MNAKLPMPIEDALEESNSASESSENLFKVAASEMGSADSLKGAILSWVSADNYEKAIKELEQYIDSKPSYPAFKQRSERYLRYAIDLVNGIKAKKSFPGIQHLAMSKQQELNERAKEHFEDLKVTLKKVEAIEAEVRLEDIRSTVWVVKALIYSICAIVIFGFVRELSRGVLPAANVVIEDASSKATNALFDMIGW